MIDPLTWWAKRLSLPRRKTKTLAKGVTESYVPGIQLTAEIDQPWVVYTYGRIHDGWWPLWRSSRVIGRAAIGMECAICGEREVCIGKLPRFGEVPIPKGGKHPDRVKFLREHEHPDRPAPMAWERPLLNPQAHPGGLSLDALQMRLQADLMDAEERAFLERQRREGAD